MTGSDPTAGLPPKPDPITGEPRPPHGPNFKGNDDLNRQNREKRQNLKPDSPPGQGPVLAWYQGSRSHAINGFVWTFLIGVVAITVISWAKGYGAVHWLSWWPVWLIIVLGSLGVSYSFKSVRCSAGVEWLRENKQWVRLYELTAISVQRHTSTSSVRLTDAQGRTISPGVELLWSDRLIWDLMCNGIRHSAAKGATYNDAARKTFELPDLYATGPQPSGDTGSSSTD